MEKLKMIEANLKKSLDLCEWVLRRERKKRDLAVRLVPCPRSWDCPEHQSAGMGRDSHGTSHTCPGWHQGELARLVPLSSLWLKQTSPSIGVVCKCVTGPNALPASCQQVPSVPLPSAGQCSEPSLHASK